MKTHPRLCRGAPARLRQLERAAGMLKLLAHCDRLRLVEALEQLGPAPVHVLTARLGRPQPVTSHHLLRLRRAGVLGAERRGKETWYFLADRRPLKLLACLCSAPRGEEAT